MEKKIIFQKFNKNYIYFLLYIVTFFINYFLEFYDDPNEWGDLDVSEKSNYYLPSQILAFYIINISDFISIIPHYILQKNLYHSETDANSDLKLDEIEYPKAQTFIYNDREEIVIDKKVKRTKKYCIIVGILYFLQNFWWVLYYLIETNKEFKLYTFSCICPLECLLQFFISCFLLKIHFYRHHYLSIILNLFIFIFIFIIDLINVVENKSFDGKILLIYPLIVTCFALELSFAKKVFLYGYRSPYYLLKIRAYINFPLVLLLSIIFLIIDKNNIIRIAFFFDDPVKIIKIIADIFIKFLQSLFLYLIIERFAPNYLPLAIVIQEIIYFIIDKIENKEDNNNIMGWDLYPRVILYFILFIGVMIHNEIIIINVCDLGSHTKYFFDLKVISEELYSETNNPKILLRYDSRIEMENMSLDSSYEHDDNSSCLSEK